MRQLWLYNRQVPLGAIINPEEGERVVRAAVLARRLADQQLNLANTSEGQLTLVQGVDHPNNMCRPQELSRPSPWHPVNTSLRPKHSRGHATIVECRLREVQLCIGLPGAGALRNVM
jgi:hypothetical protein